MFFMPNIKLFRSCRHGSSDREKMFWFVHSTKNKSKSYVFGLPPPFVVLYMQVQICFEVKKIHMIFTENVT